MLNKKLLVASVAASLCGGCFALALGVNNGGLLVFVTLAVAIALITMWAVIERQKSQ